MGQAIASRLAEKSTKEGRKLGLGRVYARRRRPYFNEGATLKVLGFCEFGIEGEIDADVQAPEKMTPWHPNRRRAIDQSPVFYSHGGMAALSVQQGRRRMKTAPRPGARERFERSTAARPGHSPFTASPNAQGRVRPVRANLARSLPTRTSTGRLGWKDGARPPFYWRSPAKRAAWTRTLPLHGKEAEGL